MSQREGRKEYLERIRKRYRDSDRFGKKLILDEMCATWEYSRKYAIRVLNGIQSPSEGKAGRKRKYSDTFVTHLKVLWLLMNQLCSKNMKAALPLWLPFYKDPSCTDDIRKQLLEVSAASMDRMLKPYRHEAGLHGLSTTRSSWVKNKIPIELLHAQVIQPGYIEADTVAHCGDCIAGEYAHSLTMTDLYSGWTENRACLGKQANAVLSQIRSIERSLPFPMLGLACDNGTEFLNEDLYHYLTQRAQKPIHFVRRRPYKKNDAAHVEQKNFTHVRQLFGYERIEDPAIIALMNEIYCGYWNPLLNYFTPTLKLEEKTRIGAKIKKKYSKPQTPVQRLLDSDLVNPAIKRMLIERRNMLNPVQLKQALEKKLKIFFQLVEIERKQAA
jgi:hypothetical protein